MGKPRVAPLKRLQKASRCSQCPFYSSKKSTIARWTLFRWHGWCGWYNRYEHGNTSTRGCKLYRFVTESLEFAGSRGS